MTVTTGSFLSGNGIPDNGDGANGDHYRDRDSGRLYYKENDVWGAISYLQIDAMDTTWYSGEGAPSEGQGSDNDYYRDTSNQYLYQKVLGTWVFIADLDAGSNSPFENAIQFFAGEGSPASDLGKQFDLYRDRNTNVVYERQLNGWAAVGTWTGGQPIVGILGYGHGAPTVDPENPTLLDGQYYRDMDTQKVYFKDPATHTWSQVADWGSSISTPFSVETWDMGGALAALVPQTVFNGTGGGSAPNYSLTPSGTLTGSGDNYIALSLTGPNIPMRSENPRTANLIFPGLAGGDTIQAMGWGLVVGDSATADIEAALAGRTPSASVLGVFAQLVGGTDIQLQIFNGTDAPYIAKEQTLGAPLTTGQGLQFTYNDNTGEVLLQVDEGTPTSLGFVDLSAVVGTSYLKEFFFLNSATAVPVFAAEGIVFNPGYAVDGFHPFLGGAVATLPGGAADGKVYLVTAPGYHGGKTTERGDYVQLYNDTADIIITRLPPIQLANSVVLIQGEGAPDNALGHNGNLYLNTTNKDVYFKAAGAWSLIGSWGGGGGGGGGDTLGDYDLTPSLSNVTMGSPVGLTLTHTTVSGEDVYHLAEAGGMEGPGGFPGYMSCLSNGVIPLTSAQDMEFVFKCPPLDGGDNATGFLFGVINSEADEQDVMTVLSSGTPTHALWGKLVEITPGFGAWVGVDITNNVASSPGGPVMRAYVPNELVTFKKTASGEGSPLWTVQFGSDSPVSLGNIPGLPGTQGLRELILVGFSALPPVFLAGSIDVIPASNTNGHPFQVIGDEPALPGDAAPGKRYWITGAGTKFGVSGEMDDILTVLDETRVHIAPNASRLPPNLGGTMAGLQTQIDTLGSNLGTLDSMVGGIAPTVGSQGEAITALQADDLKLKAGQRPTLHVDLRGTSPSGYSIVVDPRLYGTVYVQMDTAVGSVNSAVINPIPPMSGDGALVPEIEGLEDILKPIRVVWEVTHSLTTLDAGGYAEAVGRATLGFNQIAGYGGDILDNVCLNPRQSEGVDSGLLVVSREYDLCYGLTGDPDYAELRLVSMDPVAQVFSLGGGGESQHEQTTQYHKAIVIGNLSNQVEVFPACEPRTVPELVTVFNPAGSLCSEVTVRLHDFPLGKKTTLFFPAAVSALNFTLPTGWSLLGMTAPTSLPANSVIEIGRTLASYLLLRVETLT